jgi:squalene synthase HpnC
LSELTELDSADDYCRRLSRRHYENFTVVSRFVSADVALDLARIYAFSRTTDDLGDESGTDALTRLAAWRSDVESMFAGRLPIHPVLLAVRETIRRRATAPQPFFDLIQANVQDQTVERYENWGELHGYCMLSAAPVGRMVLSVFGVSGRRAFDLSNDVCVGLQLANHAQDVGRDARRGRCYLLQTDLRAGELPGAVRALCLRARDLLRSGIELESLVPAALRAQLALYRLGGGAVVDAIERAGYRTDITRPVVTPAVKALLLGRALFATLRPHRHAATTLEPV